jgi:hypothetical protein
MSWRDDKIRFEGGIPPWTLCVEDASLQHLDEETFYFEISYMDI